MSVFFLLFYIYIYYFLFIFFVLFNGLGDESGGVVPPCVTDRGTWLPRRESGTWFPKENKSGGVVPPCITD